MQLLLGDKGHRQCVCIDHAPYIVRWWQTEWFPHKESMRKQRLALLEQSETENSGAPRVGSQFCGHGSISGNNVHAEWTKIKIWFLRIFHFHFCSQVFVFQYIIVIFQCLLPMHCMRRQYNADDLYHTRVTATSILGYVTCGGGLFFVAAVLLRVSCTVLWLKKC